MARSRTPGSVRYTVTTGNEWKRVEAALRTVDVNLAEEFRGEMRDAANALARRTQSDVMRIPAYGAKHSGLRARVAQGVGVKLTASGVVITTSMNYKDERNLPAYLDRQAGWRHPVYGNRSVWVHQDTGGSWFRETISNGEGMIHDRFEKIFDRAAREIARAGA